jgi:hypothetical protein
MPEKPEKPYLPYIMDGLRPLAVKIDSVKPLPGNPRRGDVEATARSLQRFRQRKPIVVHRDTGEVEAGNHTLEAAISLGWEYIAVLYVEESPEEAKAFSLADNRTGDLGGYDDDALAKMIQEVFDHDAELLAAASYGAEDIEALLAKSEPGNHGLGLGEPVISYTIVFDTAEQQTRWHAFVRGLKAHYGGETIAERLDAYLESCPGTAPT